MMRADYDAAAKWTPVPAWADARLAREGWTARSVAGLFLVLVSGDLAALAKRLPMPEAGLWAVEPAATLGLRIARDRALLVSAAPLPLAPGWHAGESLAVSEASDAFAVFELAGPVMAAVAHEAVSADLDAGSPSAATLFAGVPAFLHRIAPDAARLVVECPMGAYVWRWLETRTSEAGASEAGSP